SVLHVVEKVVCTDSSREVELKRGWPCRRWASLAESGGGGGRGTRAAPPIPVATLEGPAPPGAATAPKFAHPSEADFARILTFYGIRWEYEPRSFPLRTDGDQLLEAFTPDFYLPDYDQYIELTTLRQSLATIKNRKLRMIRELYPEINIKLLNRKDLFALLGKFGIETRGSAAVPQIDRILFTESEIHRRVEALGRQISDDYAGGELVLVGVLRGVTCFMADLMRAISLPVRVDYLALSPYQPDGGNLRFTKALAEEIPAADGL